MEVVGRENRMAGRAGEFPGFVDEIGIVGIVAKFFDFIPTY